MAILYANFTDSSVNYGNYVIEYATQQFLKKYINNLSFVEFDSFKNDIPEGNFDFLFIPGCTMITPGQNKSLNNISNLNYKSYCLAGSLWYNNRERNILVKSKVINIGKKGHPDLSIVKNLSGTIGCRDNFTFKTLRKNNLNSLYTGCPTLFLDSTFGVEEKDYVLFSFGRGDFHKQVYYGSKIAKKYKVIGIVHEKGDDKRVKAAGWKQPVIDFQNDIELYLSYFKKASFVVSGRLHGVLPALAYNKKSFYFGTDDTRTSILHDLGVRIHKYSDIPNFENLATKIQNHETLDFFRRNMETVANEIFMKC